GTVTPRASASATSAPASGWFKPWSAPAATASSSFGARPLKAVMSATAGRPIVRVPVLSKTIASTSASFSIAAAPLIRMPSRAAPIRLASIVVGAATRMPLARSKMRIDAARAGLPVSAPTRAAVPITGSTKRSAIRRAWSAIRVSPMGALSRNDMIRPARESAAEVAASTTRSPSPTTVIAKTRASFSFNTGIGSPVSRRSSTSARPRSTVPSTGTRSPLATRTRSPARTSPTFARTRRPSTSFQQDAPWCDMRAPSSRRERRAVRSRRSSPPSTRAPRTAAVIHCPVATVRTIALASSASTPILPRLALFAARLKIASDPRPISGRASGVPVRASAPAAPKAATLRRCRSGLPGLAPRLLRSGVRGCAFAIVRRSARTDVPGACSTTSDRAGALNRTPRTPGSAVSAASIPAWMSGSNTSRGTSNRTRAAVRWATLTLRGFTRDLAALHRRVLLVQLVEAVERPVHELVPARVHQPPALPQQVSNSERHVDRGDGEAKVHVAPRHQVQLRVGAPHHLLDDRRAAALWLDLLRLPLECRRDLEAGQAKLVDDHFDRVVRGEAQEKAPGRRVRLDAAHVLGPLDATGDLADLLLRARPRHTQAHAPGDRVLEVHRFRALAGHLPAYVVDASWPSRRREREVRR